MAINVIPGQVAVSDPSPGGPNATSNDKNKHVKIVKLTNANFGTSAVNTLVAVLAADASITGMDLWVKTQLAGGGVTAANINVGTASGGTQFVSAFTAFGTAGTLVPVSPINNICQNYSLPLGSDINIWVGGTAVTGTPTSGELYLMIHFVR